MNILLFLPDISRRGGVERVVANLANLFITWPGYKVTVLSCFNTNTGTPYHIHPNVGIECLNARKYPAAAIKKMHWYVNLAKPLSDYLNTNPHDFVLANGSYLCTTLSLTVANGAVKIGCEHIGHHSVNLLHKIIRRVLYPRLDKLVVLTAKDRIFFSRFLNNVTCIPNFLENQPEQQPQLTEKVIISAGRLSHQKGFDLLLGAFAKVSKTYPDWRLVIYGEGEERAKLEDRARKLEITKLVELPGETEMLAEKFSTAAFFVMSSRYEGFPMTLLEAMQAGLACISFNCSGPDEIIDHNTNGILVEQGDVQKLAEAVTKLIADEEKRKQIAENARRKIMEYTVGNIGKKWEELLR
ncbi:MAG TPA: glycosyltransferase family 4 protein [Sphingobacteriaceae bacterium]|nr:glycosyltransferase family 4 protein [Sphingobacteriaceae bacterium]